jgi:hypothetical protein
MLWFELIPGWGMTLYMRLQLFLRHIPWQIPVDGPGITLSGMTVNDLFWEHHSRLFSFFVLPLVHFSFAGNH